MKLFQSKTLILFVSVGVSLLASIEAKRQGSLTSFQPRSPLATTTQTAATDKLQDREYSAYKLSQVAIQTRGGITNTVTNAVLGSIVMALIEKGVKETFKATGVSFPSQLAGCLILFAFLLGTNAVAPDLASDVFDALTPGAALLAKWLPVFFVPALVMLPLSPSIGNALEVSKVLGVMIIGFVYSLCTTTFSVQALMKLLDKEVETEIATTKKDTATGPPPKPFSDSTQDGLMKASLVFGAASILAIRTDNALATPLNTAFYFSLTVFLYVFGARLPASFVKFVHPLLSSAVLTLSTVKVLAKAVDMPFLDYLSYFRTGSLSPMKTGAGDILLYLLGPSVVSFAISMYSRRVLLAENFLVVMTAMLVSSLGGLYGTAAFVRLISLGGPDGKLIRLSCLPRNVTTALAMAVAAIIGGDISITAALVSFTGIIGGSYGKPLLNYLKIHNPIIRGLGIGASAQGLGVASMADEPDTFPFAAMSMVLTAICVTVLASIPVIRDSVVNLALGPAIAAP